MRKASLLTIASLTAVFPVPADAQTRASSHEDAVVMAFRRLCVDIFPSLKLLEEMRADTQWERVPDPSIMFTACYGPSGSGQVDQPLTSFVSTEFGYSVKLSVFKIHDADKLYTTCSVSDESVDSITVVEKMRADVGLADTEVGAGPSGYSFETWTVGRFNKPYRLSAYRSNVKGVILTLCDDPTNIVPRP